MIEDTISQQSLLLARIMKCSLLCAPDTSYGSSVRYSLRQVAVVALVFGVSSHAPHFPYRPLLHFHWSRDERGKRHPHSPGGKWALANLSVEEVASL